MRINIFEWTGVDTQHSQTKVGLCSESKKIQKMLRNMLLVEQFTNPNHLCIEKIYKQKHFSAWIVQRKVADHFILIKNSFHSNTNWKFKGKLHSTLTF